MTTQRIAAITPAVVSVSQDEGSGSGINVDRSGMVLTNAHVVGNSRMVAVGLADGRTLDGRVLGRDPTVDVAVVRVPTWRTTSCDRYSPPDTSRVRTSVSVSPISNRR